MPPVPITGSRGELAAKAALVGRDVLPAGSTGHGSLFTFGDLLALSRLRGSLAGRDVGRATAVRMLEIAIGPDAVASDFSVGRLRQSATLRRPHIATAAKGQSAGAPSLHAILSATSRNWGIVPQMS